MEFLVLESFILRPLSIIQMAPFTMGGIMIIRRTARELDSYPTGMSFMALSREANLWEEAGWSALMAKYSMLSSENTCL